jgi:hypothetical protein
LKSEGWQTKVFKFDPAALKNHDVAKAFTSTMKVDLDFLRVEATKQGKRPIMVKILNKNISTPGGSYKNIAGMTASGTHVITAYQAMIQVASKIISLSFDPSDRTAMEQAKSDALQFCDSFD